MTTKSGHFSRQLKSEMTMFRTDKVGHLILVLTFLASVAWGLFMCYLTIAYQHKDTNPNPRVPAGGLAQLGYFGLMVWAITALLGTKAKGFWNMRVLAQPRRPLVTLSTLVLLTVWSAIFAIAVVAVSTLAGVGLVKVAGLDSAPLVGTPEEIATVLIQMTGLAVGAIWFAAGWALVTNSVGTAATVVVVWPFIVEGMMSDEGIGATLREFMPFVNALAWFQGDSTHHLPWPDPVGLLYFLLVSLAWALFGVWMRRNETVQLNS